MVAMTDVALLRAELEGAVIMANTKKKKKKKKKKRRPSSTLADAMARSRPSRMRPAT